MTNKPNTVTDDALLPCPFCGSDDISSGEATIEHEHDKGAIYKQTGCLSCGAMGCETKEDDIYGNKCDEAWNTRSSQHYERENTELTAQVNQLREALTSIAVYNGGLQDSFSQIIEDTCNSALKSKK